MFSSCMLRHNTAVWQKFATLFGKQLGRGGGLRPPHPHFQSAASAASGGTHLSYMFIHVSYIFLYVSYIFFEFPVYFVYFHIFPFIFSILSYIFLLFPINPLKGLLWNLAVTVANNQIYLRVQARSLSIGAFELTAQNAQRIDQKSSNALPFQYYRCL